MWCAGYRWGWYHLSTDVIFDLVCNPIWFFYSRLPFVSSLFSFLNFFIDFLFPSHSRETRACTLTELSHMNRFIREGSHSGSVPDTILQDSAGDLNHSRHERDPIDGEPVLTDDHQKKYRARRWGNDRLSGGISCTCSLRSRYQVRAWEPGAS
jgi:hypothetical protein